MSVSTENLNFSGHQPLQQVEGVAVHRADVHLGQARDVDAFRSTIDRTRSLSSAAAFSVNVNAMTLRGSTPGCARIAAIRWEMTCVLPDPRRR